MVQQVANEAIYEALFDDEALARLPILLASAGGGRSSVMHWRHLDGAFEVMASSYFTAEVMAKVPEFLPFDPWTIAGLRHPNRLWRLDELTPADAFEKSIFYNELVRPFGDDTARCMGIVLSTPFGCGTLSVHRGRTQAPFDEDDRERLASHLEAFKRVLAIRGELANARRNASQAEAALDALSFAMMTIGPNGRIITTNAGADVVLQRPDGLVSRQGKLVATHPEDAARLDQAIARATGVRRNGDALSIRFNGGAHAYRISVAPVGRAMDAGAALVIFRDPCATEPSLNKRLRSLFGLTEAEAAIAVELGRGAAAAEVAKMRGVTQGTLKAQLKSLAAKMDCRRQSQIAALVAGLPPLREPRDFHS